MCWPSGNTSKPLCPRSTGRIAVSSTPLARSPSDSSTSVTVTIAGRKNLGGWMRLLNTN
ncbi:unnamed protein product [Mycena citricolor]|uniref:Uncharacterized protein n=1 Tax=Mycena citricolor TaxID=2018698 RepID=A0AAD2HNJ9_9AGAR|nr:unnamed protein product [Mycena citricolor]CAK5279629.1 unnamed protein product [Mycena citricolor]